MELTSYKQPGPTLFLTSWVRLFLRTTRGTNMGHGQENFTSESKDLIMYNACEYDIMNSEFDGI